MVYYHRICRGRCAEDYLDARVLRPSSEVRKPLHRLASKDDLVQGQQTAASAPIDDLSMSSVLLAVELRICCLPLGTVLLKAPSRHALALIRGGALVDADGKRVARAVRSGTRCSMRQCPV